jgi:hypothetical protein
MKVARRPAIASATMTPDLTSIEISSNTGLQNYADPKTVLGR